MNLFQKITKKLCQNSQTEGYFSVPEQFSGNCGENDFSKMISKRALKLYERQCDIKRFSKLVLSDPENLSHEKMVEDLINSGVKDYSSEDEIDLLTTNERLMKDLGIID